MSRTKGAGGPASAGRSANNRLPPAVLPAAALLCTLFLLWACPISSPTKVVLPAISFGPDSPMAYTTGPLSAARTEITISSDFPDPRLLILTYTNLRPLGTAAPDQLSYASLAPGQPAGHGPDWVEEYDRYLRGRPRTKSRQSSVSPTDYGTFATGALHKYILGDGTELPLRLAVTQNSGANYPALFVWVETGSGWVDAESKDTIASHIAKAFLPSDNGDGIYKRVASLVGREWRLEPSTQNDGYINHNLNQIHVVLARTSTSPGTTGFGNIGGFFASRDLSMTTSTSFQAPTIVINGPMLSQGFADLTKEPPDDFWWNYGISTLAHELQHLAAFYQRFIRQGIHDSPWFRELLSMMVEELVAADVGVPAVTTAAPKRPSRLRRPDFLYFDPENADTQQSRVHLSPVQIPVGAWLSAPWPAVSYYASAAVFGGYLLRNFGGAALVPTIIQSSASNSAALSQAISKLDQDPQHRLDYNFALARWGAALVLSDQSSTGPFYRYGALETDFENIDYSLDQVRFWNGGGEELSVPMPGLEVDADIGELVSAWGTAIPPGATHYIVLDRRFVGSRTFRFATPEQTSLSFILRPAD